MGMEMRDSWQEILESMEPLGPATVVMDPDPVFQAIPDTLGKTMEQIAQMPPLIRSLKCGKGIEKGEPRCSHEKFTKLDDLPDNNACNDRDGKTSWHPGWYVRLS